MSAKNKYRMPVPQNLLQRVDRTSPANVGNLRKAVDFVVPPDTPVLAGQMARSHSYCRENRHWQSKRRSNS